MHQKIKCICSISFALFPNASQDAPVNDRPLSGDLGVALTGGAIVLGSLFLPWISTRGPSTTSSPAAVYLAIVPWVILFLVALCIGAFARSRRSTHAGIRYVAAGSASLLFVAPIITTILLDVLAIWTSPAFLPKTWRRVFIGVSPAAGTWLAIVGASLLLVAVVQKGQWFKDLCRSLAVGLVSLRRQSLGAGAAIVGIITIIVARYEPWFILKLTAVNGSDQTLNIPGYALPLIGISALFIAFAAVGIAGIAVVHPSSLAGSLLVIMGWLTTLPATFIVILSAVNFHARVSIPLEVRHLLAQWSSEAYRGSNGNVKLPKLVSHAELVLSGNLGAKATLLGGLVLGASGILLTKVGRKGGTL